ncbi:hypothetical protein [Brevundimonas sp.]|uniref:hypothetical protein n=1 Tax=Brevundimonas sp. TaxID=1871086 RepID=UPI00378344FF
MIFDAAMIEALDGKPAGPTAMPHSRPGEGSSAVHLRQDGDRWTWMLIAEDGKSVAAGEAPSREAALRGARDADRPND